MTPTRFSYWYRTCSPILFYFSCVFVCVDAPWSCCRNGDTITPLRDAKITAAKHKLANRQSRRSDYQVVDILLSLNFSLFSNPSTQNRIVAVNDVHDWQVLQVSKADSEHVTFGDVEFYPGQTSIPAKDNCFFSRSSTVRQHLFCFSAFSSVCPCFIFRIQIMRSI